MKPQVQTNDDELRSRHLPEAWQLILIGSTVILLVLWSYWQSLAMLSHRWFNEADYSHGFFVPVFSMILLWWRRDLLNVSNSPLSSTIGVILIALAAAMRLTAAYYLYPLVDPISLLPLAAGIALLLGGWPVLNWAWPSILFLGFMVPLPGFISDGLSHELQRIGTVGSVYILQTFGVPAVAQGNVIWLTEGKIGVVEACSGLRMLNVFVAICCGGALLLNRPIWEKLLVLLSALPIGIAANVLRISVTGILFETVGAEWAERVFHDMAGLLMMPLAMLFLGIEMFVLSKLLVEPSEKSVLSMNLDKHTS
ncbi:exosortase/archaeosortase family protein [Bremerella cremea]|uniref:Exosortase n=1 Tax=Blastopirellula marina TaxID=124 RepID=A0A2S8FC93_9BACT|nr:MULTISPECIES: exosortase/archaeosortase family protein [Pirellulaceae]PQO29781.1 exosortase [Blastopirellula marina]RCS43083.1 exosortase/archaeosortase family protein [Bremerella cremea]